VIAVHARELIPYIADAVPGWFQASITLYDGSGKELAARTIHALSSRTNAPFVVINAAAITPDRMEVELFGVEGGNGSGSRKVGALEEAHGGTLFLDEIAEMPRETQNKIMRVLVDQTFQRVGGSTKVSVDVRIVSSTGRHIESDIAAGKFREDLYHRLSVVPVRVPSLSERREDISQLIAFFTNTFLGPIFATGVTLFYYDQRIRKEGYDIEWMMQAAGLTVPEPVSAIAESRSSLESHFKPLAPAKAEEEQD